ncbi:MAG: ABC transporter ATP-binding protein [Planctomycetota bacterium]|jgi:putative ABC transport system ATP-binding protein
MNNSIITLRGISRVYGKGDASVHALRPTDLDIAEGHFVAVMGPSGSGKSTLLNVLGMLDRPTGGEYMIKDENVSLLDDDARSKSRCLHIGFVFQSFNLLNNFTVLENVCVPMQYAEVPEVEMKERAEALLERFGLADRLTHRPAELSGGQCQRVAIARALANNPTIIMADEPTGNLDEHTGDEVLEIFHELREQGRTIIMVTHNPEYKSIVERVITLHDGSVTSDEPGGAK